MTTHHAQHRAGTAAVTDPQVTASAATHRDDVATMIGTAPAVPGPVVSGRVEPGPAASHPGARSPAPRGGDSDGDRVSAVRVAVDNTHCAVFGICVQEAPQVFDLGVDGRLRYNARPAAVDTARVRQAARVCPMQAIAVTDRR